MCGSRRSDLQRVERRAKEPAAPHLAALAIVGLLCYGATLSYGYFSEDFDFAYSMSAVTWSDLWHMFVPQPARDSSIAFYRPLGFLLWRLGGRSPVSQHAINLTIHLLNGFALYALLRRVRQSPPSLALLAAGLFVAFPTHNEAVVWCAGRFDLLATLGVLCAVACSVGVRRVWLASIGGALAMFVGLLSKEIAAVTPVLATLLWLFAPQRRQGLIRLAPLWVLLLAYVAWRYHLFGGIGGYRIDGRTLALAAPSEAIWQSIVSLLYFVTLPLNVPALITHARSIGAWPWLAAAAVAGSLWAAWRATARSDTAPRWLHDLGLALAWVVIGLAPAIGLYGNRQWLVSSRFAYLAAAGAAWALALGAERLRAKASLAVIVAVALLLCAATIQSSNQRWRAADLVAQRVITDIRAAVPRLPPFTVLQLPALPDSERGVFVLRNGIVGALRMAYPDETVDVQPLTAPPPARNRFTFKFRNDAGRLVLDKPP
jgi:hypothetical protein